MACLLTSRVTRRLLETLRRSVHTTALVFRAPQGEDMDQLQKNPYYAQYAGKIAKLQNTSPQEFLDRLAKMEEESAVKSPEEREFSMPTRPKSNASTAKHEKNLDDIFKLELIDGKSKEEIAVLWKEHFATRKTLNAVIDAKIFTSMKELYTIHKTFLLPLPRKHGYEFFVVQFAGNNAHFTSLINFQAFKENAPEALTVVHYTDLAKNKGIVLMLGEFDENIISLQEAQYLAYQIEMYYCNPSSTKKKLLEKFTLLPQEFKHQDLIAQIENISLLTEAPSSSAGQS